MLAHDLDHTSSASHINIEYA
jgi:hypothetical protein